MHAAGLLLHANSPVGGPAILRLSRQGIAVAEEGRSTRIDQRFRLAASQFSHASKVLHTRLAIEPHWQGKWIPESALGRGKCEIPDGIWRFPSGAEIYIELENSTKAPKRFLSRLHAFTVPILTLYVAASEEVRRSIERHLLAGRELPPVGLLTLDNLVAGHLAAWSPGKTLYPFARREF